MNRLALLTLGLGTLVLLTLSRPVFANTTASDALAAVPELVITTTRNPVADAYVDSSSPKTNYGSAPQLRVDGSPIIRTYLRFSVSGLTGAVSQALLRLYANSSLNTGITVARVANNTWSESTLTFSNAPAVGSAIKTSGPVSAGAWISLDVTAYVIGNGTFSFVLTSTNPTALSLASREAANKPQLVIQTNSPASPTATPTRVRATATATRSPSPSATATRSSSPTPAASSLKLIGWNDLGMHCLNQSFANLAVLPPFNTLWAQLIRPGPKPQIVTQNVTIAYNIVDNTYSAGKTDFWTYAGKLFPGSPSATQVNVGLKGARLSGQMGAATDHFVVEGVPLTPFRDSAPQPTLANLYPYQLAHLVAKDGATGKVLAETTTVAPVSTEMNCALCHSDGQREGIATGNVETNILTFHDREAGTKLMSSRPVLCANCHGSNALGLPGNPELPNLSRAMHEKHAGVTSDCYNCHPGVKTQCLRDVMYQAGVTCTKCHGGMSQVADSNRRPWIDLPKCGSCHGATYAENTGKRYRDSTGHGGLYCEACHGSPHAILPTIQPNDNLQSIALQGHAGTISDCKVCHTTTPTGPGPHGIKAAAATTHTTFALPFSQR